MIPKLKAFWASLPHQVQAAIIFGGSATLETVGHAVSEGKLPSTLPELKHFLASAIAAGLGAAWAFYRLPNGAAQLVAQAKAQNAQNSGTTQGAGTQQLPPQS